MQLFLSAFAGDESSLPPGVEEAKQNRMIIDFITSMRATVVSLGMYPQGSATIANAVEKVAMNLENVLAMQEEATLSEVSGRLLVDERQLDGRDLEKAPVADFLTSMIERQIQSITFRKGTSSKELVNFLVIISQKPDALQKGDPLAEQLKAKKIENIQVNDRIYVATSQEEQAEMLRRDALLSKMLSGGQMDIDESELDDLVANPDQLQEIIRNKIKGEDDAELDDSDRVTFVGEKAKQVKQLLANSMQILDKLPTDERGEVFKDTLVDNISELDADVIANLLGQLSHGDLTLANPDRVLGEGEVAVAGEKSSEGTGFARDIDLEASIFEKMGSEKTIEFTEYLINDAADVKKSASTLDKAQLKERMAGLKKMLKMLIQSSMDKDFFSDIAERLTGAGLVKGEMAKRLMAKAASTKNRVKEPEPEAEPQEIKLVRSDGSIDETALKSTMDKFSKLPLSHIPYTLDRLGEIIGEIVFHDRVGDFIDVLTAVMDGISEFGEPYKSCSDFLEKLARELIFNENYGNSLKILSLFQGHADPDKDRHHEQKKYALRAIDAVASEEVNRMLLTVYQHGEEEAKQEAGTLVVNLGNRMLNSLIELLKTSEDRSFRRQIIELLKQMGQAVLEAARGELSNSGNPWYMTRNMVILLGEMGSVQNAEWLQPMLSHEDARVRRETVKALANLDPENSIDFIRQALTDPDPSVKGYALANLGTLNDVESIAEIAKFLIKKTIAQVEEEEQVQMDAVSALGKMDDPTVIPYLLDVLKKEGIFSKARTKSPKVRERACWALSKFPSPEVAKALKSASKDSNSLVSDAARSILAGMPK